MVKNHQQANVEQRKDRFGPRYAQGLQVGEQQGDEGRIFIVEYVLGEIGFVVIE
jgi:hypothetical protein